VEASSHIPLYSLVESTHKGIWRKAIFVSARTNKRHHHLTDTLSIKLPLSCFSTLTGAPSGACFSTLTGAPSGGSYGAQASLRLLDVYSFRFWACTSVFLSPWSFGFDSQTRGTRENRAPSWVKVPGSSRVPPPMGWWLGLAPATLEFWVRFLNERNQGKQGAILC
jgi:hypothetical protein